MADYRVLATDGFVWMPDGVVLLERSHPPHEGKWVLPGGLVERGEAAREACSREVKEEVGLDVRVGEFVGLYDDPGRDPRGNASAAYVCRPRDGEPRALEEATAVGVFPPDELPVMGFDHREIVGDALGVVM